MDLAKLSGILFTYLTDTLLSYASFLTALLQLSSILVFFPFYNPAFSVLRVLGLIIEIFTLGIVCMYPVRYTEIWTYTFLLPFTNVVNICWNCLFTSWVGSREVLVPSHPALYWLWALSSVQFVLHLSSALSPKKVLYLRSKTMVYRRLQWLTAATKTGTQPTGAEEEATFLDLSSVSEISPWMRSSDGPRTMWLTIPSLTAVDPMSLDFSANSFRLAKSRRHQMATSPRQC
ncbi:hypothetical protein BDP27DRAFT_632145 [Rhodocollybia butyracea]|uniref:Uncharacterized protein n=1 Tax=Rhodocollybia butyracea TaxID=206335 RepID=A0A9P5PY14_9AGAR|nr:hypothetical protein BDP27DRAFT_632145 [Rhodocollybia butyracea]